MNQLIDILRTKCNKITEKSVSSATFVGARDAGFLFPDGKFKNLNRELHLDFAKKQLSKLPKSKLLKHRDAAHDLVDVFMLESGAIRYINNNTEFSIEVAAPVSKAQLKAIYKESKGKDFYYDLADVSDPTVSLSYGSSFSAFTKDLAKYGLKESMLESSIDFPRNDLDSLIWDKIDNNYILKDEIKGEILSALERYPAVNLLDIADKIRIVGSIASNTYSDSADVDVHVVPKNKRDWTDEDIKDVMEYFKGQNIFFGDHPLEVYIQKNPNQDLMSEGCYDVLLGEWEKTPTLRSSSYNPYENFKHVFDELSSRVVVADELLGELKRDVIDYFTIKNALGSLEAKDKKDAMNFLEQRLEEIETTIEDLYKERKKWADARKFASKPGTPEEALKDIELAKSWADENAVFKFINRYQYIKLIGDLHAMLEDDELDDAELQQIRKDVGADV